MFCELSSIIGPPKVNAFQLQSCRLMELCGWCDFRGWMHKNVIVFSSSKEVIFWDSVSTGFLFYLYLSNSGVSIYVSELNYLTTSHSGDGRDLIHPESAVILNSSNGVSRRAIHQSPDWGGDRSRDTAFLETLEKYSPSSLLSLIGSQFKQQERPRQEGADGGLQVPWGFFLLPQLCLNVVFPTQTHLKPNKYVEWNSVLHPHAYSQMCFSLPAYCKSFLIS